MEKKIVCTRWLQASWKSTWASQEAKERFAVVYNKDTIRQQLHNGIWSKANEKEVVAYERSCVMNLVNIEYPYIIVDNTHLGENNTHIEFYRRLAEDNGYEFEIKDFDTPLWECIDRDAKREKSVGAKVILDTYNKYCKTWVKNFAKRHHDISLPQAYIFDIDWTLAHMNGRSPYDYSKVWEDSVDFDVAHMARLLYNNWYYIIIVSWRKAISRKDTEEWLEINDIPYHYLNMRKDWDDRNDAIVKKEIAENLILPRFNVRGVFDDRDRVVHMWRELWLTCFQVAYWNF